jgi:hypothetical protein
MLADLDAPSKVFEFVPLIKPSRYTLVQARQFGIS